MNDHDYDELELELASFRPLDPSRELRQRIAESLTAADRSRWNRRSEMLLRAAVVTGGLLAASVVIMLGHPNVGDRQPVINKPVFDAVLLSTLDERSPSLWVYRQASLRSPAALDELFDKHSRGQHDSSAVKVHGFLFTPINNELNSFSGEL